MEGHGRCAVTYFPVMLAPAPIMAFRYCGVTYVIRAYYRLREPEYRVIKAHRYVFRPASISAGTSGGGCYIFALYFNPSSASRVITT